MECKQSILVLCGLMLICIADCAPPPPALMKCKADDEKCIRESTKAFIPYFAHGMPEYNVASLDPLFIKHINASGGNLLFLLSDVTVKNLSKCEVLTVKRDAAKSKMFVTILCTGQLDGQYKLDGNLLFVPIQGEGPVHAQLRSCQVDITFDHVDKVGEDGKNHWQIKSWSHTFVLKDKADVKFENLYSGNEVLGRAARELVENHGNDIVTEIGPEVIKALVSKVIKAVNNFFKAVASEYLSLD